MKSALLRSVIAVAMLVVSGLLVVNLTAASTPGYIPLQPAHTGHWHNPSRGGEGLVLSVWATPAGPVFFGQVYLVVNGQQPWIAFDGITHAAWNGEAYELVLYARDTVNGDPFSVGSAWLRPYAFGGVHWTVLIGDIAGSGPVFREAMLSRLTPEGPDALGFCGQWVFAPPLQPADPVFCH